MTPASPAVGAVVEGDSEYHLFPSFVAKILGYNPGAFPRINARGCDNLVVNLEEQLDLMAPKRPVTVLISVDSRDFRDHARFRECVALKEDLIRRSIAWRSRRSGTLWRPAEMSVVIQHRCFETWLLADRAGLVACSDVDWTALATYNETNVDEAIVNPLEVLGAALRPPAALKDERTYKRILRELDLARMVAGSRSFKKFRDEVLHLSAAAGSLARRPEID